MMAESTMAMPMVYDVNRNDGFMGGSGSWVFFLFFLLALGGNGFGGFGGGNAGANFINNDFMYSNLTNQLGRIQDQNQFIGNSLQQGLCSTTYELAGKIAGVENAIESCCCATQKELLVNRYEAEKNTCAITNAIHAEGEATRALINANTMQDLRDRLQAAELGLSQQAQTANLLAQLKPCAVPAYTVSNPYCGTTCGTIC